ncbi:hypothetical protein I551_0841 [Mycobacterium ulcerans str. Harvey]|uniref:Uncharacterized protein n=1 Tax=Mycobacterium ulcerans str. Harvey TaxID=1299332 RepID=A0ABN0R6N0_MYCUL|nr:hypothetical protein MMSP_1189 [Mycobacterium sp. 012931]EUA92774.1 hypothetical protein I551_0841 [Mycobacterium ulcerans str. Harvey]
MTGGVGIAANGGWSLAAGCLPVVDQMRRPRRRESTAIMLRAWSGPG